jgi:hypothetical protein
MIAANLHRVQNRFCVNTASTVEPSSSSRHYQVQGWSADTRFGDAPADASEQVDGLHGRGNQLTGIGKPSSSEQGLQNKRPVSQLPWQSLYFYRSRMGKGRFAADAGFDQWNHGGLSGRPSFGAVTLHRLFPVVGDVANIFGAVSFCCLVQLLAD